MSIVITYILYTIKVHVHMTIAAIMRRLGPTVYNNSYVNYTHMGAFVPNKNLPRLTYTYLSTDTSCLPYI